MFGSSRATSAMNLYIKFEEYWRQRCQFFSEVMYEFYTSVMKKVVIEDYAGIHLYCCAGKQNIFSRSHYHILYIAGAVGGFQQYFEKDFLLLLCTRLKNIIDICDFSFSSFSLKVSVRSEYADGAYSDKLTADITISTGLAGVHKDWQNSV